jgi:hypothetical protein
MIDDKEHEFEGVVKILKELQKVKSPNNFEADLMRRINSGKFKEEKIENWFSRIFVPRRFIPSAALAVAAVLILFVIKPGSTEIENPFNTKPKLRKDIITTSTQLSEESKMDRELQKMADEDKNKSNINQKDGIVKNETKGNGDYNIKNFRADKPGSSYASSNYGAVLSSGISNFYSIEKSGLNFRQVNLTKTERMEIDRLKANLMRFMKENRLK